MRHVPQGDVNRTQTLASPPRGAQLIFALDAIFPQANLPGWADSQHKFLYT